MDTMNSFSSYKPWKKSEQSEFAKSQEPNIEKYNPSKESSMFWNHHFSKYDEVSIGLFITSLLPTLEKELQGRFTYSQVMNFIDQIDYENKHTLSKYEAYFFIDKIWNSPKNQSVIVSKHYETVSEKLRKAREQEEAPKPKEKKSLLDILAGPVPMLPLHKRVLSVLEQKKMPCKRNNSLTLTFLQLAHR